MNPYFLIFNICSELLGDLKFPVLYIFSKNRMCEMIVNSMRGERPTGETLKLYEQIVIKNFQILKTILPRMNSLYQLNEQLERSVSNIETRLVKMESDHENLHYEMRTSHLAIDSKLNSIIAQYNNINNETNKVKKQTEFLSKELKEAKSKHFIERTEKEIIADPPPVARENGQERPKRIAFADKDEVFPNLLKNKTKNIEVSKRSSISIENEDSPAQASKVHFNLAPVSERASQKEIASVPQSNLSPVDTNRKTTFKSKKSIFNTSANLASAKSQKQIKTSKSIQPSQGKSFEKFLKEIENYHFHNQKMKQNYEELMEEYCKANETNFSELNEKINELTAKLIELDPKNNLLQSIKTCINLEFNAKFEQINAKIANKIDRAMFQRIMGDFNARILGIHEERKKTANREETKRALQFLEKKINSVLNDYYEAKQRSLHHVSVDKKGCLRVADLLDQPNQKEYNRQKVMQQAHMINNTPRTIRNESAHLPKRQSSSLHARILNGTMTENRFNQKEWRSINTEKGDSQEEVPTHRHQQTNKKVNLLKKKAYQILDKEKVKERPKLKKQRLIFQYD